MIMPYTSAMKRVLGGGTTLRSINVQVASSRISGAGSAADHRPPAAAS